MQFFNSESPWMSSRIDFWDNLSYNEWNDINSITRSREVWGIGICTSLEFDFVKFPLWFCHSTLSPTLVPDCAQEVLEIPLHRIPGQQKRIQWSCRSSHRLSYSMIRNNKIDIVVKWSQHHFKRCTNLQHQF